MSNESDFFISNAGLAILNPYFAALFGRMELLNGELFKSETAQQAAVQYLQYLCTGTTSSDESQFALNKILCGLPLTAPINNLVEISDDQKELMNSLITAAISHWSVIGDMSLEAFREAWLQRDGKLTEESEHWTLLVEKKAYDVLLQHLPWSISIIKLPWMRNPFMLIGQLE